MQTKITLNPYIKFKNKQKWALLQDDREISLNMSNHEPSQRQMQGPLKMDRFP